MKNIKAILAMLVALCLMISLAVPAMATAETVTETTAATTGETVEETAAATVEETAGETVEETAGETVDEHAGHDHSTETTGEAAEEEPMSVWKTILTVLEVLAGLFVVIVILMQSGKEAGLSGAISGNSESYMNKSGKGGLDKALAKATKWVALAWLVLTLVLSLIK